MSDAPDPNSSISTPEEPRGRPRRREFGVRHLMFLIALSGLLLWGIRDLWQVLLLCLVTVAPVVGACLLVVGLLKQRATQQEALLSVLTIAAEHQLPLAPGAEAFSGFCRGGFRRRVLAFAYLLDSGVTLPETLRNIPGLLPSGSVPLATVGWGQGALAVGLREARASYSARKSYMPGVLAKLGYFAALLLAMQAIGGFILYFIAPKFEAIFQDFGVPLPELTRFTIQAGHFLLNNQLLPVLVLVELGLLIYVPFAFLGFLNWRLPFSDWVLRRRDSASVLRGLAITVEAGNPIPTGLSLLREDYPVGRVRRNLDRALVLIAAGTSWVEALRSRGLIGNADVAVLAAAERAGNLAWALRTLAEGYERRLGFRLAAFSQLLLPIVVLAAAAAIGLMAVGYFLPLVQLIEVLGQ